MGGDVMQTDARGNAGASGPARLQATPRLRLSFSSVFLASLLMVIGIGAESAQNDDPCSSGAVSHDDVHPLYLSGRVHGMEFDSDSLYAVDGKLIPNRYCVDIRDEIMVLEGSEAKCIEFVLVGPGSVEVGDLSFEVRDPFYIATTQLSNVQYAELTRSRNLSYDEYREMRVWGLRTNIDLHHDEISALASYFSEQHHPALNIGIDGVNEIARQFFVRTGMFARHPTVAEWYRAMRAESEFRYWWGDRLDLGELEWDYSIAEDRRRLSIFGSVYEGPANPIGIKNMIGQANDVVYPSDSERSKIRRHMIDKQQLDQSDEDARGLAWVQAHTLFRVGGRPDDLLLLLQRARRFGEVPDDDGTVKRFDRSIQSVEHLVKVNQVSRRGGITASASGYDAVRFAVDIPEGDWQRVGEGVD